MGKHIVSTVLALVLTLGSLNLHSYAVNYDSDWRMAADEPRISFRDEQGEPIPELMDLWVNDEQLCFDASTVSYGDLPPLDYRSFDLSLCCVDYNYMIFGEGSNLPDEDSILAELSFGKAKLEPQSLQCSATSKGYLQLELLFEDVNFLDDENREGELYLQYRRKTMDGDETADFYKGTLPLSFANLQLPQHPQENPDEPIQVEVLLPDKGNTVNEKTPYLLIEECHIESASSMASGSFSVELTAKNIHSSLAVENVLMQVDTPAGLSLNHPGNSFYLGTVAAGESLSKELNLTVSPDTPSGKYAVSVKFSYEYVEGTSRREESISQKFIVPVHQEEADEDDSPIESKRPYLLIEDSCIENGGSSATAGTSFQLSLRGKNIHNKLDVENVLLQVETPEGLRLENPSNIFYLGTVKNKEEFVQNLQLSSRLNTDAGDYPLSLRFSYEYMDGQQRKEESITQELVIPLQQSSRFVAEELSLQPTYNVGEEHKIFSSYANLGRGSLYNVTLHLNTELYSPVKVLHLGNLSAGEGGAAEFSLQAQEVGNYPLEILYSYETENGKLMEQRLEAELNLVLPEDAVEEEAQIQYITEFPSPAQSDEGLSVDTVLLLILSALGLAAVLLMLKKSNK